jgi:hypothetical protein
MTMDATGQISPNAGLDNSTLQLSGNLIVVKDGGVTQAKLNSVVNNWTSRRGSISVPGTPSYTEIAYTSLTRATDRPVLIKYNATGNITCNTYAAPSVAFQIFLKVQYLSSSMVWTDAEPYASGGKIVCGTNVGYKPFTFYPNMSINTILNIPQSVTGQLLSARILIKATSFVGFGIIESGILQLVEL